MTIRKWKCQICSKEILCKSKYEEKNALIEHLKSHKEFDDYEQANIMYRREESELSEKYKKRNLGQWFHQVQRKIKRKFWKCPTCKREMSYYEKRIHEANKGIYCKELVK